MLGSDECTTTTAAANQLNLKKIKAKRNKEEVF